MADESWHGTRTGYESHRCPCSACKRANADYQRVYRRARAVAGYRQPGRIGDEPPVHGTSHAYKYYGCRCDLCRAENTAYYRAARSRRRKNLSA